MKRHQLLRKPPHVCDVAGPLDGAGSQGALRGQGVVPRLANGEPRIRRTRTAAANEAVENQVAQTVLGLRDAEQDALELGKRVEKLGNGAADVAKVKVDDGDEAVCGSVEEEIGQSYFCLVNLTSDFTLGAWGVNRKGKGGGALKSP